MCHNMSLILLKRAAQYLYVLPILYDVGFAEFDNRLRAIRFTLDNVQYMYCALCSPLQTRLRLEGAEITDHLLQRHNLDEQVAKGGCCQWPQCWFQGALTTEVLYMHYLDVHFQNAMPIDFDETHRFLPCKRAMQCLGIITPASCRSTM